MIKIPISTGFKDINGREIKAGDILREPITEKWQERDFCTYEVCWHEVDKTDCESMEDCRYDPVTRYCIQKVNANFYACPNCVCPDCTEYEDEIIDTSRWVFKQHYHGYLSSTGNYQVTEFEVAKLIYVGNKLITN